MRKVRVHIPSSNCSLEVVGENIKSVLDNFCNLRPEFQDQLMKGSYLLPNVILFLNDERVFDLNKEVKDGDEITLLNAIAGG